MSWSTISLGEIAEFRNGLNYTQQNQGEGLPVINVKDFQDRSIPDYNGLDEINPMGIVNGESLLKDGDIIFVRSNGNKDLIGRSMYIASPPENLSFSAFCIRARIKNSEYSRFYAYFFRSPNFRKKLSLLGSGTNISNLNQQVLKRIEVPRPPIIHQIAVVNILSPYDDLIENNHRRIQLLEESARLLYQEWFVRLRFPGHEHTNIVDGVPEGWRNTKFEELGEIITGKTPSTKNPENYGDDIPFIKTPDMHNNPIIIKTEQKLSELGANTQSNKFIPPGSLQISCIGTVGIVSINSSISQTNQQINSIIPLHDYYRYYLYFCLSGLKSTLEGMGGGSTMANINKSKFSHIQVVIPSNIVLMEFHSIVHNLFCQIEKLMNMNYRAIEARDLLLPRLMNGVIPV